jgi:hypothetical protein
MNALLASHGSRSHSPRPRSPDARRNRAFIAFAIVALISFAIDGAIAHSSRFFERPELFTAAISFDLTLGVTIAYWLIVVRRGHAAMRTLLPVFVLSVGAATLTLPPGHRDFVHYARLLAAPFELAIFVAIVIAVRSAKRRLAVVGTELDLPERIRAVLQGSLVSPRIADVVATETSIFYYALASWRRTPFAPTDARAFSYHLRNGAAAIIYTLAAASAVEVAVVDLLVRLHAPRVANALIALGIVSTIWLIGFARAVQLRPHFVSGNLVALRNGLQRHVEVAPSTITSIEVGRAARDGTAAPNTVRFARGGLNVLLRFAKPVEVRGVYGTRRTAASVALVVDNPSGFVAAIETARMSPDPTISPA